MRPRALFRVLPTARGWKLVTPARVRTFAKKSEAVTVGRTLARACWDAKGRPAQLIVHTATGRIAFENTYGRDPERYRG